MTGGQLRPTDRAMAASSACRSSSEEGSRSTDEEDRLLTKRCIEKQWKNTSLEKNIFESEKTSVRRDQVGSSNQFSTYCQGDVHTGLGQRPASQTVTSFFPATTTLSHDGPRRSRSFGIAVLCVLCAHPPVLSHGHKKTSSSTVEMTSSATICSRIRPLCSSGAPPPTRTTLFTSKGVLRLREIALQAAHLGLEIHGVVASMSDSGCVAMLSAES